MCVLRSTISKSREKTGANIWSTAPFLPSKGAERQSHCCVDSLRFWILWPERDQCKLCYSEYVLLLSVSESLTVNVLMNTLVTFSSPNQPQALGPH